MGPDVGDGSVGDIDGKAVVKDKSAPPICELCRQPIHEAKDRIKTIHGGYVHKECLMQTLRGKKKEG